MPKFLGRAGAFATASPDSRPDHTQPIFSNAALYRVCFGSANTRRTMGSKNSCGSVCASGSKAAASYFSQKCAVRLNSSQIEQAFAKHGYPRIRIVAEANSLAALFLIVSTTQLVSLINARNFDTGPLPFDIAVRPIQLDGLLRQVGLIRRAGYLSPIAQRAQEILRNAARELYVQLDIRVG
jgi:hypothetical protein